MICKKGAERRLAAEADQQQVASDDWRQHQRQWTTGIEQATCPRTILRASSMAMVMPNGSATTVDTAATRNDSATAVQSWGERSNTRRWYRL